MALCNRREAGQTSGWLPAGIMILALGFGLMGRITGLGAPGVAGSPRFEALVADAASRTKSIGARQLDELVGKPGAYYLIDVREDSEWAAGRLPRAIHVSRGVLERDIEAIVPDPEIRIILYCGVGTRSVLAADSLRKMGYRNVSTLEGGYKAWVAAGLPVVRGGRKASR